MAKVPDAYWTSYARHRELSIQQKLIRRLDLTANVHICNRRLSSKEQREFPEFAAELERRRKS